MIKSDFTKEEYSPQDFLRLVEHRIRKEIRQNSLLSTKKSYRLSEEISIQSQVLKHFLTQIFQGRLELNSKEPSAQIIKTDYLEMFISNNLEVFLENKPYEELFSQSQKTKTIMPLKTITEHEVQEVANILSLKGTFTPCKQPIISSLAQKYPQTKPSFLKSFINIQTLQQQKK